MRVAILKGNRFNPWHLTLYLRAGQIAARHERIEMTAFVPGDNLFELGYLPIDVQLYRYEHEAGSLWKRATSRLKYRMFHESKGYEFFPSGLKESLRNFDLVQTWETFNPFSLCAAHAAVSGKPKLLVTQWDDLPNNYSDIPCKWRTKEEVRRRADGFLVYTDAARKALEIEGVIPDRIFRLWPAVDMGRFEKTQDPVGLVPAQWRKQEGLTILFAGRLVKEKGIFDLLEAAATVNKSAGRQAIRLLFVGSGRDENRLQEEIAKKDMQASVRITPRQPYDQIPAVLAEVDAVALLSRPTRHWREQFGMIAIEALAAGKCVIASRTPGMTEMLGDCAALVEPGDIDHVVATFEQWLSSEEQREILREKGRLRARQKFDIDKNAQELNDIYRKILAQ